MFDDSSNGEKTRRELLARMGTGLVAITIGTAWGQISPQQARASGAALRRLSDAEGKTLEALGDVLLPGAAAAGIAHYVDDQLSSETPLLILKYMDYSSPFLDFYQQVRIPAKANGVPTGSRTAFRAEAEHHRSVATPAL